MKRMITPGNDQQMFIINFHAKAGYFLHFENSVDAACRSAGFSDLYSTFGVSLYILVT